MFAEERYRLDPPFEPPDDLFWQHEMNDEDDVDQNQIYEEGWDEDAWFEKDEENEDEQNNICDGGEVE